jgi:hypothetical protein
MRTRKAKHSHRLAAHPIIIFTPIEIAEVKQQNNSTATRSFSTESVTTSRTSRLGDMLGFDDIRRSVAGAD